MTNLSSLRNDLHKKAKSLIPTGVLYLMNKPFFVLTELVAYSCYVILLSIEKVKKSLFISTAETIEDILNAGSDKGLNRKMATRSFGKAVIQGEVGKEIEIGSVFLYNSNEYATTKYATIVSSPLNPIKNTSYADGVILIDTISEHSLASGTKIDIQGYTDQNYNGSNVEITVKNPFTFSYVKSGISSQPSNNGTYSLNYALLYIESKETGIDKNVTSGEILEIQNGIDGVETNAFVTYDGLTGGSDDETIEDLRSRGLKLQKSFTAPFGLDYFENLLLENVPNINQVKILPVTPLIGHATIIFTVKNYSSIIPTQSIIDLAKEIVDKIKSPVMNLENFIIEGPNEITFNVSVKSQTIITELQRKMARGVVKGYFSNLDIGIAPSIQTLKSIIDATPDLNGEFIENSTLTLTASGNFNKKSIAIPGEVTF